MTLWVDTSKEFENNQLELWGWRMREKGWRRIFETKARQKSRMQMTNGEEWVAMGIKGEGQLCGSRLAAQEPPSRMSGAQGWRRKK